jgi:hypothetical protein
VEGMFMALSVAVGLLMFRPNRVRG